MTDIDNKWLAERGHKPVVNEDNPSTKECWQCLVDWPCEYFKIYGEYNVENRTFPRI